MDWNFALQFITLIAAILSPVLVTILNNRHVQKLEKAKFQRSTKLDVLYQFVNSYSRLPDKPTGATGVISDFISDAYKAAVFLDEKKQNMMFTLINTVYSQKCNGGTRDMFTDCLLALFNAKS
jgi:hypothetical protein